MARFAIIIPTRNRPASLRMTLKGLVELRWSDVSFLVSDNSDMDFHDENYRIVSEIMTGRDYSYVRPDRVLPMSVHWNFALENAPDAEYTGIVTDRMTLVPDALSVCNEALSSLKCDAVCFNNGVVSVERGTDLPAMPRRVPVREIGSFEALTDFSQSVLRKDTPRFLNSFVSRACMQRIRHRYGSIFGGISPDYGFAFRFLDVTDRFAFINAPILIDHCPSISNGMAMTRNIRNDAAKDFVSRVISEQSNHYSFGPIPDETTLLPNIILRELEIAKSEAVEATNLPVIDRAKFHLACAKAMRRSHRLFDPHSRQLSEVLEAYRVAHDLPRLSARVRRTSLARTLKNTLTRWADYVPGHAAGLPGALRDEAGDQILLGKLRDVSFAGVEFLREPEAKQGAAP